MTSSVVFEEPGVNFTCMGVGTSSHVWAGCADGRALILCVGTARHTWIEAFRQCRVSASFCAQGGHGLLADHAGNVQLWIDDALDSSAARLGEAKLATPKKGDKNQRLLCAKLLQLPPREGKERKEALRGPSAGDLAWLVGDEHGSLHLIDLQGPHHKGAVHEGKVLCIQLLSSGDQGSEFLSAGADGTVVRHRLDLEGWTQLAAHRPGCGLRHLAHLSLMKAAESATASNIPPLLTLDDVCKSLCFFIYISSSINANPGLAHFKVLTLCCGMQLQG